MKSKYAYKTSSWNQMIKNDKDFSKKFELNTNPQIGPTYIPKQNKTKQNDNRTI